jgi:endonuclease/exonuclease/phosphatase family metal-dependent hydrolase
MNFFNPEYKTDSRIDHIFLSPHFKVHKFGLHTYNYWQPIETEGRTLHKLRSLSDHYPIDAVVELPQD